MEQPNRNYDPIFRFNQRIIKDESGCWIWQGKLSTNGYAVFKFHKRNVQVHRWAYETYKGSIPEGMVVDHLCNNRCCVNPDHLEPITLRENIIRASTHCRQKGHLFTEENSLITSKGTRLCRICDIERRRKYKQYSDQLRWTSERAEQRTGTTTTLLVVVPHDSSWRLELEKLKCKGIVLDFSENDHTVNSK